MKMVERHAWNISARNAAVLQKQLADAVSLETNIEQVRIVAGSDVSYSRHSNMLYAGCVLMHYPELTVLEERAHSMPASFPYVPGLLSFREGEGLMRVFDALCLRPDLILFDGQGIAHPRFLGIASHLGVLLGIPSIGVGKSKLVGEGCPPERKRGALSMLSYKGRAVCAEICTKDCVKPLYISPGHKVSMEDAAAWALRLCRGYKLPEPIRAAHAYVNRIRIECEHTGSSPANTRRLPL